MSEQPATPASGPAPVAEAAPIRDAMTRVNVGSPQHAALEQRLEAVYRQHHAEVMTAPPEPGAAPLAEPGQTPPDETAQRPGVVDDAHATPQTAAELDLVPLPEGLDPEKNQAINLVAEREGLTGFVLEGRRVVTQAATGPPVDAVAAERQLHARWGSAFPSKLEAAHRAFDTLPSEVRADLERRELDVHPAVLAYLARVGEEMMNPLTPGGWRRLKEKYSQVEAQTK